MDVSITPQPYARSEVEIRYDPERQRDAFFHAETGEPLLRVAFNGRMIWLPYGATELVEVEHRRNPDGTSLFTQETRYAVDIISEHQARTRFLQVRISPTNNAPS